MPGTLRRAQSKNYEAASQFCIMLNTSSHRQEEVNTSTLGKGEIRSVLSRKTKGGGVGGSGLEGRKAAGKPFLTIAQ